MRRPRIVTTGGTGYIPPAVYPEQIVDAVIDGKMREIFGKLPIDTIRARLYRNMWPYAYAYAEERLRRAVKENKKDLAYGQISSNKRDDIWAQYLQIPNDLRKGIYKIEESDYKPTKGDGNLKYFKVPYDHKAWLLTIDEVQNGSKYNIVQNRDYTKTEYLRIPTHTLLNKPLNVGENALSGAFSDYFGQHTIGRGYDDRGEYVSYYDKWDISPITGYGEDLSRGIGTPIEFYDRMYLDDWYGVNTPTHSLYLPEVIVKSENNQNKTIPHLSEGTDKFTAFAERLGPMVYRGLVDRGVLNIDTAYDNMMRQLAWESSYGLSPVARKQNNYGGYGWNGKTYTTFKNDEEFVNSYLDLMMKRYGAAVNSPDVYTYARNLKNKGYYEDTYEHYSLGLAGMKSMSKAAAKHRKDHPELYDTSMTYIPVDETKMGPDAKGYVRPPKSAQLETPLLTLPVFNIPVVKPKETKPKSRLRQELLPAMMKIAGLENVLL